MRKVKKYIKNNFPTGVYLYRNIRFIFAQALNHSLLSREYYLYYPTTNLIYLVVPKTGNSTINAMLLAKENAIDPEKISRDYLAIHREKKKYTLRKKDVKKYESEKIAIVRNPYDRLKSCYANKVQQENYFKHDRYFNSMHKDISFEQFVKLVCKIPDQISDRHFRAQNTFLYLFGKPLFTKLFTFEDFQQILKFLEHEYGVRYQGKQNVSQHTEVFYTEKLAKLVYNRYKKDFQLFGYRKDSWQFYN